jgi:hypothetical protein
MRLWLESLGLGPMIIPAQPQALDRFESVAGPVRAGTS